MNTVYWNLFDLLNQLRLLGQHIENVSGTGDSIKELMASLESVTKRIEKDKPRRPEIMNLMENLVGIPSWPEETAKLESSGPYLQIGF